MPIPAILDASTPPEGDTSPELPPKIAKKPHRAVNLDKLLCPPHMTIEDAIRLLNDNHCGILLIVDSDRRLIGTITDGDYRRAMLAHVDMQSPVSAILEIQAPTDHESPLMRPEDTPHADLLALMNQYGLRHIPLVDSQRRVTDVVLLENLIDEFTSPEVVAVVMAGGFGTRLRPLTEHTPKPMLPVGGQPLLHHIVTQLSAQGIQDVNLTTHYKPDVIKDYFGSGEAYGININYVNEETPLGTAGATSLLPEGHQTLLVMNGDILTQCNFSSMIDFHRQNDTVLTVGVRKLSVNIPYGVVDIDGTHIVGLREKPCLDHFVNAGIYLVERSALAYVPQGQHFHMTHLIEALIADGQPVNCFPITEYWMDIGQINDYTKAQDDAASWIEKE